MDADVKKMFKIEIQIKKMLAKRIDDFEKHMIKMDKWHKQHDVRLNEHWKHINKGV